jgi:hypothetical protein
MYHRINTTGVHISDPIKIKYFDKFRIYLSEIEKPLCILLKFHNPEIIKVLNKKYNKNIITPDFPFFSEFRLHNIYVKLSISVKLLQNGYIQLLTSDGFYLNQSIPQIINRANRADITNNKFIHNRAIYSKNPTPSISFIIDILDIVEDICKERNELIDTLYKKTTFSKDIINDIMSFIPNFLSDDSYDLSSIIFFTKTDTVNINKTLQ